VYLISFVKGIRQTFLKTFKNKKSPKTFAFYVKCCTPLFKAFW